MTQAVWSFSYYFHHFSNEQKEKKWKYNPIYEQNIESIVFLKKKGSNNFQLDNDT